VGGVADLAERNPEGATAPEAYTGLLRLSNKSPNSQIPTTYRVPFTTNTLYVVYKCPEADLFDSLVMCSLILPYCIYFS
jgi:hypothetical protein